MSKEPIEPKPLAGSEADVLRETFARLSRRVGERTQDTNQIGSDSQSKTLSPQCGPDECCLVHNPMGESRFVVCAPCNPRLGCPTCRGSGLIVEIDPVTQTEQQLTEPCPCTTKERKVTHLNAAGLPPRYLDAGLRMPELLQSQPDARRRFVGILKELDTFANEAEAALSQGSDPEDQFFSLFYGPVGSGKTYLAAALLKRLILRTSATGRFVEFQQLMFSLRSCYAEGRSEEELLAPLRRADILVIDELGKGRTESEWQMERLDDLVNSRYNSNKLTIFTTNFAPAGVAPENALAHGLHSPPATEGFWTQSLGDRIGLRIYDRIMEAAKIIDFSGLPSLRRLSAERIRSNTQRT
jgi:DNA replication protein DnaC